MQAVFFDLDGTLIDSRADFVSAINQTRRAFGLAELPFGQVVVHVGEGMRRLVSRTLPEIPEQLEEAAAYAQKQYGAHLLDHTTLYPGVAEALRVLGAAGWRRALVTNKPREFIRPILQGLGVLGEFEALVGGGDTQTFKPDPAPVLLAAERLGVRDLTGSWIVGDHFTDLEVGRRLGLRRCFCRYGFGDRRGEEYDLAVDSLAEVVEYLGASSQ